MLRRRKNLLGLTRMLAVCLLAACLLAVSLQFSLAVSAQSPAQRPGRATDAPAGPTPVAPFRPIIVDLGAICGGQSYALAINAAGAVAGWCDYQGVLWQNSAWTDFRILGRDSVANALNDAGLVAGANRITDSSRPEGVYHAALWNHGVISDLGTLGGPTSNALGINNHGTVVGTSRISGERGFAPFLWENGVMTPLASVDGIATAINDPGQVVGEIYASDCCSHAVLWYMGVMTDLSTLGGRISAAYDINNLGQVVGHGSNAAETQSHAVLWANGVITDLGELGGRYSIAYGINDLGQVVGSSTTPDGVSRAFFWDKGVMRALPMLGGKSSSGCNASAVNEGGLVVGYCYDSESIAHAVLWDLWDNSSLFLPVIRRQAP